MCNKLEAPKPKASIGRLFTNEFWLHFGLWLKAVKREGSPKWNKIFLVKLVS